MIKTYIGRIDGNVIRLDENLHLPKGMKAIVTLRVIDENTIEEITKRQLAYLQKGFILGRKLYNSREELYAK
jgi:hypothetical protein